MRRSLPAVFLCAALPAAAPLATAFAQPAPTQTLRIAIAEDADQLDPVLARTFVGRIVFAGLCDKLFDIDEKLNIVPMLATSYEYTDSKTLVLHLRPGVMFQDGTPMDAAAVKYTLDRDLNFPGSSRKAEVSAMDHAEVVDPTTLRVVLKATSAPFIAQLTDRAGMIVSPKAAEAAGKDFAAHPVCAGPFSFSERVAQDHITLDRFPGYWNAGAIHFAHVIYKPIVDNSIKLANLQAGTVDMAERIAPTDTDAVRKDSKLKLLQYPSLGYNTIHINVGNGSRANSPLGQDERVRKAFELSIDRDALNQVVYGGVMEPLAQAFSASSPWYDAAVTPPPRDVAKARALLAEAKVKTPFPVSLTVSNSPDQQQLGEVIQSMAAEAGFDVKVQPTEFVSLLNASDNGDYQATILGWSGRADPDGNLYGFLHSGSALNDPHYANKDMDNWLDQARQTTVMAERKALYDKVAVLSERDLPYIYLYGNPILVGASARLGGFKQVPDGMLRLQDLTLAQ